MFVSNAVFVSNAGFVSNAVFVAQGEAAVDQTGRRLTMIIIALLAIALLLSGLTTWYWQRTDPRRKGTLDGVQGAAHQSSAVRVHPVDARVQLSEAGTEPLDSWAEENSAAKFSAEEISAEEWLRLTGPAKSKSKSGGESRG